MTDRFGRNIDYLRLSITDRCNLRCKYCMPEGVDLVEHRDLLRYEELLSVARAAVSLGITHFKVTGGEPLVRRGCLAFLKELKALPGVEVFTPATGPHPTGVVSFRAAGRDCEELAEALGRRGIALRAGLHCAPLAHRTAGTLDTGTVRLSLSDFNTPAQIEKLAQELHQLFRETVR